MTDKSIDKPIIKKMSISGLESMVECIESCMKLRLTFTIHMTEYILGGPKFTIIIYAEEHHGE